MIRCEIVSPTRQRDTEGKRYTELVQRALTHLPVGTSTVTRLPEGDVLAECAASAMATAVLHAWPEEMLERDLELAREYGARLEEARRWRVADYMLFVLICSRTTTP